MKNKLFLLSGVVTFACLPRTLRGSVKKPLDKYCEIKGFPYVYCESPDYSGRACGAMLLTHALDRVVSLREVLMSLHKKSDSLEDFGALFSKLGMKSFHWKKKDFSLEEIKRIIEEGKPVILQGFFDCSRSARRGPAGEIRPETTPLHAILIFGFNAWGFFVHDPFGLWLGKREWGYKKDLGAEEKVFAGRDALYLFRSLRELAEAGGLTAIAWSDEIPESCAFLKNKFDFQEEK